ncbi:benzoquinone reductase [Atractiella rhizophila]|nr:benzoquinone reductase [Atractiella rhizophila]
MAPRIAIVFYSLYGHIKTLSESVAKGAKAAGATVDTFQLPETLPENVLQLMHAPPKSDYPVLSDPSVLKDYDGFLFGIPTRYGRAPAQWSSFFDTTGGLWMSGALVGKAAGIFSSTGGQHGGQETTALTTIPFLAHHGITYIPIGFADPDKSLLDLSEIVGGSAYGAATISGGDGSRQPSAKELAVAEYQGKYFATQLGYYVAGKAAASQ